MTPFGVLFWTTPNGPLNCRPKNLVPKNGKKFCPSPKHEIPGQPPPTPHSRKFCLAKFLPCKALLRNGFSKVSTNLPKKSKVPLLETTKQHRERNLSQPQPSGGPAMEEILHQLIWRISHYLHPRWLIGFFPSTVSQPAIVKAKGKAEFEPKSHEVP